MFIEIDLVERAMHIPEPWYIDRCQFNEKLQQPDVFVKYHFPHAPITFDQFHVIKNVNEAVDEVRRNEQKTFPCPFNSLT